MLLIATCLVLADRLPLLTAPLCAVGAMALPVYATHVVVIRVLMTVDPLAADGPDVWLVFTACAVVAAGLWRAWLGRGPLERLLTWSSTRAAAVGPRAPAG